MTGRGPRPYNTRPALHQLMPPERQNQPDQATPDEMLARGKDPDLVFQPELAADVNRAVYAPGTAIELVTPLPPDLTIRYAIFDHDGTISTLRHGWEQIMEPVMLRAIFGRTEPRADPAVHVQILQQVREFIDKTTGIQTLLQMHGLAQMVRAAGLVPANEVLDAAGYKRIYNESLMNLVERRLDRLRSGELGVNDYTMKNAVPFLQRLHQAGIRLYLTEIRINRCIKDEIGGYTVFQCQAEIRLSYVFYKPVAFPDVFVRVCCCRDCFEKRIAFHPVVIDTHQLREEIVAHLGIQFRVTHMSACPADVSFEQQSHAHRVAG